MHDASAVTQTWRPSVSWPVLQARANIFSRIRRFFQARDIIEVDTPILAHAPVTDPYISALSTDDGVGNTLYLQTSPEYAMKRLLAAGAGSIYQLGKAFRREEVGRLHHIEFTLLEWYHLGYNDEDLMDEVAALLAEILPISRCDRICYQALFDKHFALNPHTASTEALQQLCRQHVGEINGLASPSRNDCLNQLFSTVIEPTLGLVHPCFVYDYPATQAALARCAEQDGIRVAKRFELFYRGVELANGYDELQAADELFQRFQDDLVVRQREGLPAVPMDHQLLQAMAHGLPRCAGVALGVDRLIMLAMERQEIADVSLLQ